MIVTFSCQQNIFVYTEKSKVKPRLPYKTHSSVDNAEQHLKQRGVKEIRVIEL